MKNLKFPWMREELIDYLKGLSDINYQRRGWVNQQFDKKGRYDEFDYTVHFLYDDTNLAESPTEWIGLILLDLGEANAIKEVGSNLDKIFDKYGLELTDEQYISTPEWKDVLNSAEQALSILKTSEQN